LKDFTWQHSYTQHQVFTEEECKKILQMRTEMVDRLTMGIPFESSWLNGAQEAAKDRVVMADSWVYDRLKEYWDNDFCKCNGQWPLILKVYDVTNSGFDRHYMHTDSVKDVKRVALSISLNDDYEGGKLQVFDWHYDWDGEDERGEAGWKTVEQKIGMMTLIPVIIPHRVTKVKGTRYQLISWFLGDKLNW
tara:strand:+ start:446 stop:1018 length:573 start_codon:yes stop_codon:yes gene_type:complete